MLKIFEKKSDFRYFVSDGQRWIMAQWSMLSKLKGVGSNPAMHNVFQHNHYHHFPVACLVLCSAPPSAHTWQQARVFLYRFISMFECHECPKSHALSKCLPGCVLLSHHMAEITRILCNHTTQPDRICQAGLAK